MRSAWVRRSVGMVGLLVLVGCGGGDAPPPAAAPKPAGDEPAKTEKSAPSAKGTSKSTNKDDGVAVAKQETAKAKAKPKPVAKPGSVTFTGDDRLVKAAEKSAAASALYKGLVAVRKPTLAQRPPLRIELALEETISAKHIEDLKAKGIDTDAMQDAETIRNTARERGTAVIALKISAAEGTGDEAQNVLEESWESSTPVAGADAEARTDKELDAAFKNATEKAYFESMALALDSLALTLIAREGAMAKGLWNEVKARSSDPNEAFRKKATEVFATVAKAVREQAVELVKHPDPKLRLTGLRDLLLESPPTEDVTGMLVELLKDADYSVRSTAAFAVVVRKPDAEGVMNVLGEALADNKNKITAMEARDALIKIGRPAVPALLVALGAGAKHAQAALADVAAKDPQVITELCEALGSDDAALRMKVLLVLNQLGPAAAPAVPTLIPILESSTDPVMRGKVASVLGHLGVAAEPALPALEQAITDGIREARGAKQAILTELRKAGKNPPSQPVPNAKTGTKDTSGKTVVAPPPPPKIVKRKTVIMKDGKEVVIESFMKVGEEYRVKTPDGGTATYLVVDVKEIKVEEVKE